MKLNGWFDNFFGGQVEAEASHILIKGEGADSKVRYFTKKILLRIDLTEQFYASVEKLRRASRATPRETKRNLSHCFRRTLNNSQLVLVRGRVGRWEASGLGKWSQPLTKWFSVRRSEF
jgi:hypothetical protein